MKLLIVTCIKEHTDIVKTLFAAAQIHIFSATETTGFKDGQALNLSDSWFAKGGDQYDSAVLFSFTDGAKATHTLALVNERNKEMQLEYPIHAFILPVDSASI